MKSLDKLEKYLSDWIDHLDVKKEKPFINGQSQQWCPYAKAAWKNNKTKIVKVTDFTVDNFWKTVITEIDNFDGKEKDIVIVAVLTDIHVINGLQLVGGCDAINSYLNLKKQDKWLLNQFSEDYTMVMIQKITDLDNGSIVLEKKGYYEGLNPYALNKNVMNRRKMRQQLKGDK